MCLLFGPSSHQVHDVVKVSGEFTKKSVKFVIADFIRLAVHVIWLPATTKRRLLAEISTHADTNVQNNTNYGMRQQ